MRLRGIAVGILCVGMLCVPVLAQTEPGSKAPGGRNRRAGGQADQRGPGERGAGRGMMGRPDIAQQMEKLTKELSLTQDQQDKIRKLITDHQEQMNQQMRKAMQENMGKAREIRKQIDETQAAGDAEKVKTLEAQRRELMGEEQRKSLRQKLVSDIEALLTAEQKTKFAEIKDEVFPGGRPSLQDHPEILWRAVQAAKLSTDKEQKIKGIVDEWKTKAMASTDRKPAKADAAEVYKKVMAELTPEEQATVKAWQPTPDEGRGRGQKGEAKGEGRAARKGQKAKGGADAKPANAAE